MFDPDPSLDQSHVRRENSFLGTFPIAIYPVALSPSCLASPLDKERFVREPSSEDEPRESVRPARFPEDGAGVDDGPFGGDGVEDDGREADEDGARLGRRRGLAPRSCKNN